MLIHINFYGGDRSEFVKGIKGYFCVEIIPKCAYDGDGILNISSFYV